MADTTTNDNVTQDLRITRLFNDMPYGGGTGLRYPDHTNRHAWTWDLIEHNLTIMRDALRVVADRHNDDRTPRPGERDLNRVAQQMARGER